MSAELIGLKQTVQRLLTLEARIQRQGTRRAVSAAAKIQRTAAKADTPRQSGLLRRSIRTKLRSRRGRAMAITGQRKDFRGSLAKRRGKVVGGISGTGYAPPIHLVESPVRPHIITPRRAGGVLAIRTSRRGRGGMDVRYTPWVIHPGHRGRGFLSGAERRTRSEALSTLRRVLSDAIDSAARRPDGGVPPAPSDALEG